MKYLAALPIILLFAVLDIILLLSIIGILAVLDEDIYPLSYSFAVKVFDK